MYFYVCQTSSMTEARAFLYCKRGEADPRTSARNMLVWTATVDSKHKYRLYQYTQLGGDIHPQNALFFRVYGMGKNTRWSARLVYLHY